MASKKWRGHATDIEEFELNNSFHLKTHTQQTRCYIDHLVSLMTSPIQEEKDREQLTLESKKIYQNPRNRAKVNNFHKYLDTTFREYELNTNNGKLTGVSPRHGALAIVYICSSLSLLGLSQVQVYKLLGLIHSSRSFSSMATYVSRVIEAGCTEWFKSTLEYREWEARRQWRQDHPFHTYNINEDNPDREKNLEKLNMLFRFHGKSPRRQYNKLSSRISKT